MRNRGEEETSRGGQNKDIFIEEEKQEGEST